MQGEGLVVLEAVEGVEEDLPDEVQLLRVREGPALEQAVQDEPGLFVGETVLVGKSGQLGQGVGDADEPEAVLLADVLGDVLLGGEGGAGDDQLQRKVVGVLAGGGDGSRLGPRNWQFRKRVQGLEFPDRVKGDRGLGGDFGGRHQRGAPGLRLGLP